MVERLTREQMAEKYPNTWLGINHIKYENDDDVTVESADVVYTNKTASELGLMALQGEDIRSLKIQKINMQEQYVWHRFHEWEN